MAAKLKLLSTALLLLTCAVGVALSAQRCPNCGSTTVPYPLSTGPACGDQSYKIRCDAGSLIFDTLNNSYPIMSVNHFNQRLVIEPASLLPNTCVTTDLPFEGVQLNSTLPFNVTSSNTIMFLNCTDSVLRSPLDCSSTGLCHVYVNDSSNATACEVAPICCTFRAGGGATAHAIRVRESGCRAYTSFVSLDAGLPVNQWPQPGMELQWISPPEPVCSAQADCDGNSTCGPDPNSNGIQRCFCNSGLWWDPIEGICAENSTCQNPGGCGGSDRTALIAGLTAGLGTALFAAIIGMLVYKRHRRIIDAQERLRKEHMSHVSTCAQGTLGYLDPEYYRNYQLTDKSDVYSFGVVLLELLTSQKAIDFNRDADDVNLAVYVKRMADEEKLVDVIDPMLREKSSPIEVDTMKALGFLALNCLEERRQNRPSMKEVTEEIEYIICIANAWEITGSEKGRMGNQKQIWTAEEEETLLAGVPKHSPGKWKNILEDPDFAPHLPRRSNIALKDKWRNLSVSTSGQG
ncbi:SANT/Myb domain - like 10 [Theobroma cacao]|nr:SANT/Myb domain - like 10 [Theobroma cacao]